jgi:hypothetical protein
MTGANRTPTHRARICPTKETTMKAETVDDLDTPIRRGVRSVAETGCKKPEGVPASVFEMGDLCRQRAASECRSIAAEHGLTAGELA